MSELVVLCFGKYIYVIILYVCYLIFFILCKLYIYIFFVENYIFFIDMIFNKKNFYFNFVLLFYM